MAAGIADSEVHAGFVQEEVFQELLGLRAAEARHRVRVRCFRGLRVRAIDVLEADVDGLRYFGSSFRLEYDPGSRAAERGRRRNNETRHARALSRRGSRRGDDNPEDLREPDVDQRQLGLLPLVVADLFAGRERVAEDLARIGDPA